MNAGNTNSGLPVDVEEMRRRFDQVFAQPASNQGGEHIDFLAVGVGGRPYALSVLEIVRIEPLGIIASLPGGHPWLVGLTSIKGKLVPVFSLELALGSERSAGEKGWIAVSREESFGLAFDNMDGYCRIQRSDLVVDSPTDANRKQNQQAFHHNGALRPIVSLASILKAIRERLTSATTAEVI